MNSGEAEPFVVSQNYFVFERLLDEASGWSCKGIQQHGPDFNTERFPNLMEFYIMKFHTLGLQAYRANDANPVSALPCLFNIAVCVVLVFLCWY